MKVKLELDIEWIDEENNVDDEIKDQVVKSLVLSIKNEIHEDIKKQAHKLISDNVDAWILVQLNNFCDRQIGITDKWGDTTEHHESVTEMFKAKFDSFFNASVDDKGKEEKSCGYGSSRNTRIDYMLDEKAESYMQKLIGNMDRKISNSINRAQQEEMQKEITKQALAVIEEAVKKVG